MSQKAAVMFVDSLVFKLFFFTLYATAAGSSSLSLSMVHFTGQPLCPIDHSCYTATTPARSVIDCLARCSRDEPCRSALFIPSNFTCFQNTMCVLGNQECAPTDASYMQYQRDDIVAEMTTESASQTTDSEYCQNGGELNTVTGLCNCSPTGGYVGTYCETQATSCLQLRNADYVAGLYSINIDLYGDGSEFVKTQCNLNSWSTSINIMKSSGIYHMAFPWTEYVNSFWLGENDYWIGLENLHRYTSDGNNYRVRVMVSFNSSKVVGEIAESSDQFVVSAGSNGYSYSVGDLPLFSSTVMKSGVYLSIYLDNLLSRHAGKSFSTHDNDMDQSALKHCAQLAGAGWWFGDCDPLISNPFGLSYTSHPGPVSDEHILLPGINLNDADLAEAFEYINMSIDVV
ncbi:tenascin-r [Plakobranchus ocellatus]|uniref:Tenascin-r n=1 Tax=Plakobranchus ocellatus TaxID=259542 RepID=A0AAV3YJQ1_9GAST|nr:tenascin-r [Plakobranchus ocellatus]